MFLSKSLEFRLSYRMFSKRLALTTILAIFGMATCFESGAPKESCGDMVPQHHVAPQTSPFPYRVSINKKVIRSGDKVLITISGGGNVKDFKGFFIQGRVGDIAIGTFEPAPGVKLVDCHGSRGSGATHADASVKTQIALTWIAPPGLSETVRFRVTVAQDGGTFWVGHLSAPLQISA